MFFKKPVPKEMRPGCLIIRYIMGKTPESISKVSERMGYNSQSIHCWCHNVCPPRQSSLDDFIAAYMPGHDYQSALLVAQQAQAQGKLL